jgi:hypothetical protein
MAYSDIRWVVQTNVINKEELNRLEEACRVANVRFVPVLVTPFSEQLPAFEIVPCSIYYGSVNFNNLVYANAAIREGIFFDPDAFTMENYMKQWGAHMINYGATVTSFDELVHANHPDDKLFFIRPDDDNKSFAGEVKRFDEILGWYEQLTALENANITGDTKIVAAEPYNLKFEWRLWIVKGKVVAASRYREYFTLSKQEGCPPAVVAFAEERCKEYTPHDVFVMDICQSGDAFYIVECGCMNAAGFYKADIVAIVRATSEYMSDKCGD